MSKKLEEYSSSELEVLLQALKTKEKNEQAREALAGQLNKYIEASEKPLNGKAPSKVVRDSFTLPENDYLLFQTLRDRAMDFRINATKGEVLRAGLHALMRMSDEEYVAILKTVEKLKPGRRKDF